MGIGQVVLGLLGAVALAGPAGEGFQAGQLAIVRVGDGKAELVDGVASAVFVDVYDPATAKRLRSISMPTTGVDSGNHALTLNGFSTSEGCLALSADGRYLALAGYDAPVGTKKPSGSNAEKVPRVVARIDANGAVDTTTRITDAYSGNNIRSAVAIEGDKFLVAGTGTPGGTREVVLGGVGPTTLACEFPSNARVVQVFDGRAYVSSATGAYAGVSRIDPGQPNARLVAKVPDGPKPTPGGFVILGDALYLADRSTGLLKYTVDAGGPQSYRLVSTTEAIDLAGLVGHTVGDKVILYGTDGSQLIRFTDDGKTIEAETVVEAGENEAFRGVAFVPTTAPPSANFPVPVVVASVLGTIGLVGAAVAIVLARRMRSRRKTAAAPPVVPGPDPIA